MMISNLPSAVIMVLNYNAKDLLERFLPSILLSANQSRAQCRVMVIDNQSKDGSAEWVEKYYPEIQVFRAPANKVLCSFNDAARIVSEEVIILLNNDIQTDPFFVDPLLAPFREEPLLFGVTTHGDRSIPELRWGSVSAGTNYPEYAKLIDKKGFALSAGIGAYDRKKFLELGGYDEMYLPGYYEDVDLGFRAWQRGWITIYQPESKKEHLGSASFKKTYGSDFIQRITFRNSILFMIKNISDSVMLTRFFFLLLVRLATMWLLGKWFLYQGFMDSLKRIPIAWNARKKTIRTSNVPDRIFIRNLEHRIRGI